METETTQGTLLIADDMPTNLKVLLSCLVDLNYKVLVAQDGEDALEKAAHASPDLILLDVMMPRLDGFEACRRLKADARTKEIPVLFMTALSDTVDKVKGFEAGAVDYITKPFQREEVLARIKTHLDLRNLQKTLRAQNFALKRQNTGLQSQNRELLLFSHYSHQLHENIDRQRDAARHCHQLVPPSEAFCEQWQQTLDNLQLAVDHMELLNDLRLDAPPPRPLAMAPVFAAAREALAPLIEQYQAVLHPPAQWPLVLGHPRWITTVWTVYLRNAIAHGGASPEIHIGHDPSARQRIRFWVRDQGPGFTPEQQSRMGDGYLLAREKASPATMDDIPLGYGPELSLVQRVIDKLGGQVTLESAPEQGSTFYFSLPQADDRPTRE